IDALQLILFPKNDRDQLLFNVSRGYGADHPSYLTKNNYSIEERHKFNDNLSLHAEEATDTKHDSYWTSLKWQQGAFRSGIHFRDIDKNYTTVAGIPAYQGEIGADWTTETDFQNVQESSQLEVYRDRINGNPNAPNRLDYDGNGQVRVKLMEGLYDEFGFTFVNTAGDISPQKSLGLNDRISRDIGIWGGLKATVFGGFGYQNSQSPGSSFGNYNRENMIAGIQVPLTRDVSVYSNYEYDWLNQSSEGGSSNPSIVNAGISYHKQINNKIYFNTQVDFRDELGVNESNSSFLAGEKSIMLTGGLSYNPTQFVSIYADAQASKVVFGTTNNTPYDDFSVHVGVRITFGGATYWDPLGTVYGIVFKDRNGDGIFGSGDEGIPDVKVKVGDKEAVTDKQGRYSIKIRGKGATVTTMPDTVPGGLMASTPQVLNVTIIQGRRSRADFGFGVHTGIYGIVFVSKNGSQFPSDGDKFIGKVKVILDGKITQKTDPQGAFYFRQVSPGDHMLVIDMNSLPINMMPVIKLKNKINVAEGTNYSFNIPVKISKGEAAQEE
ncbi:MAG: hypothetical protein HQL13_05155, partial [Candidatus Omnitrophica bacterium]|nr:hypothetical protein [Candidatus Omnitrophota bacterium]